MRIEIHDLDGFDDHLQAEGSLVGVVLQGIDLQERTAAVVAADVSGCVFLGCMLQDAAREHILDNGGLLFPSLPDCPYHSYRGELYSVDELLSGYRPGEPDSWAESFDQVVYRHYDAIRTRPGASPVLEALAQRLHDHAIDNALNDLLHADPAPQVAAIMGGHAMKRTDAAYRKVARISQQLSARGYLMTSGGGPGAMEATHLGAWMGNLGETELDQALEILSEAPDYKHPGWLDTALAVRDRFTNPCTSLGIPTWFYGHEPPNMLATHIAKYFSNSLREDGLLAIAHAGVIYSPGSAGTIQEVFMDAAQNHYGTFTNVSPMVFLDTNYWTKTKPVYPLLQQLAAGRQYGDLLTIADEPDDVVAFLVDNPPIPYRG